MSDWKPKAWADTIEQATKTEEWRPIETAPKSGTVIIGKYGDELCDIFWSERPVCMLGSRCGSFPPGWATGGQDTDRNLPMDEPDAWKPDEEPPQ